jgi:thiamine biosynthesis protein ThiS
MEITINGQSHVIDDRSTLTVALKSLGFAPGQVAVAVNRTFVPKQEHSKYELQPGDRVDLISRIEGG